MMQTFLPHPSFGDTAACLDYRRLGKQRVEAKQLLLALGVAVGSHLPNSGWTNHPACGMWRGFEGGLCEYAVAICEEWLRRGYRDSLLPQFVEAGSRLSRVLPPWLGDHAFHASHRSNLLRKLPEHYSRFGWAEPDDLPYVWPRAGGIAA
jgi:hypothetical protein